MNRFEEIANNVIDGQGETVAGLIQAALDAGKTPEDILSKGLMLGMNIVGREFREGNRFVPEVLVAAQAMKMGMKVLSPHFASVNIKTAGRFMIGTVQGDIHDIGKNLVAMLLDGAGFEVIDLGVDVSVEKFVAAIKEKKPDIVGISALLSTTMLEMSKVIEAIEAAGLRNQVKIMIGGAPVTDKFSKKIGADGFAPEAGSAVEVARQFMTPPQV